MVILIHPMKTRVFQLLYASSIYISLVLQLVGAVSFNLSFSDSNTVKEYIRFEGDAHFGDFQYNNLDRISLTRDAISTNIQDSSGRATYNQPVVLWDDDTEDTNNFTTQFSFLMQYAKPPGIGDGLTFFLSPYPSQLPPNESSAQSCLGLFNCSTASDPSANHIIAVEFDTYLNAGIDPNSTNQTDCHIGIDINVIESTSYRLISRSLFVGVRMTARIEYNGWTELLSVLVWHDADPNTNFSLNATVNLRNLLPSESAVGFSASTGGGTQLNQIFSWSFNSTFTSKHNQHGLQVWIICVIVIVGVAVLIGAVIFGCYIRRRRTSKKRETSGDKSIALALQNERTPKGFSYEELCDATDNFADDNKLGQGGFGSVYKGILNGEHVAVKKVAENSRQGMKEYISEVKIISQLRHRYLVPLVGWCHDNGRFLLVYQLMPNTSLNKHLYSTDKLLQWPMRQKIALQLGEAVLYLHQGWEQCVVHRDIKPSNIMLDSSFDARLGDFGLARLIDHSLHLETTNPGAGTVGYMAPECYSILSTNVISTHSDIFSFGVVLLELTCGRPPILRQEVEEKVSLVQWVSDLYGRNTLLDAVDGRLKGDFDIEEVERFMIVGLWCTHLEILSRPSMEDVMSVLRSNKVDLPYLPPKMHVTKTYLGMDPNSMSHSGTVSKDIITETTTLTGR